MGQGGLGALLDLGSEGNMGISYMAGLPGLYAFQDISAEQKQGTLVVVEPGLCCFVDMLVWNQLPSFSRE
jgi:hypothetical protein